MAVEMGLDDALSTYLSLSLDTLAIAVGMHFGCFLAM
jgi:hypothetical protein